MSTTARLLIVRHCQSAAQHPDAGLTPAGSRAAKRLAEQLSTLAPDALYSSPYVRAQATLRPFAARVGLRVRLDDRLRERRLSDGDLEDWLHHVRRSFAEPDYSAPGGESLLQARTRALLALADIAAAGHRLPVAASHGNLIAAVLGAMDPTFGFEDWRTLRNPDLFEVTMAGSRPTRFVRLALLDRSQA